MPIQLDKILANIAREQVLHPSYSNGNKKDIDDAWSRVGKNNDLSVHDARSIFKVLQKKYEQEKLKGKSAWKLFGIMDEIHRKVEAKTAIKVEESELPMEEDEEYEMLEVQEEDEHTTLSQPTANSTGSASASDSESPTKSNSSHGSPDKGEKPPVRTITYGKQSAATAAEEKKLINTIAAPTMRAAQNSATATAAALHRKGITLKKTTTATVSGNAPSANIAKIGAGAGSNTMHSKTPTARSGGHLLEVGKTIQLPESIKRKLSEEQSVHSQLKKIHVGGGASNAASATTTTKYSPQESNAGVTQLVKVKEEPEETATSAHGINLITIPANPTRSEIAQSIAAAGGATSSTAATVASTASMNGFSPRIEEIDFRNDIIFDSGNGTTTASGGKVNGTNASDIINLGNFDNSLPPTFFKNLCNSTRHEALGLYVANVMNRLRARSAAKLELGILRAIIDVQSDELEQ